MKIDRVQTVFIVIGYFVGFEKYGIDVFYNRKYQKWLAENSTDAESLNSDNDKFVPEFDEDGFITNITFTPFENGIPLTESVYIEEQKKYLDGILKLTDIAKSEKRKIEYFINYLNDKKENLKVGAEPEKQKKRHKTLLEFINNIDDKEAFLNDLKNTFPTEIGLSIKAIVLRLVEVNILIYGTKEFKNFYEELTKYFDRSIGSYPSINDNKPDSKIIDIITLKLNPLIDKYKTK